MRKPVMVQMKTRSFILAAGIALAVALTFSCASGDDGGDGGGGGKGNDISNYKTKTIGTQTWMAENLNYDVPGSKCYNDDPANCSKYGRLYDWQTALTVCPSGWHLPSNDDWEAMAAYVGGTGAEGKKLKAKSGWNNNGNGTDEFGFSALPGGYGVSDGSFSNVGIDGNWWSASENNSDGAYTRIMYYISEYAYWGSYGKSYLLSVRCLQD